MDDRSPGGVLLIDKPPGITSHDAVARVRRAIGIRKVGHAGTLDPMATGLLVLGAGRATRLLRFLGDLPKTYAGTGLLGAETTTLDAEGAVVRETAVAVSRGALRRAMAGFVGRISQVPPAHSAVKVGGQKLYVAARAGRPVEASPRTVEVFSFDLGEFDGTRFEFMCRCSGGTYVRSLVADIGRAVGCGAHLRSLRRTAIGDFRVEDARPPDDPGPLLPLERAVDHLGAVVLDEEEARAAVHGRALGPAGVEGPYRVLAPDGRLIGIWRDDVAKAIPEVVLPPS